MSLRIYIDTVLRMALSVFGTCFAKCPVHDKGTLTLKIISVLRAHVITDFVHAVIRT